MRYGRLTYKDKSYFSYNSWHMGKLTHGEYLKQEGIKPINGKNTPMRKKFNELLGCHVFIVEIEK